MYVYECVCVCVCVRVWVKQSPCVYAYTMSRGVDGMEVEDQSPAVEGAYRAVDPATYGGSDARVDATYGGSDARVDEWLQTNGLAMVWLKV